MEKVLLILFFFCSVSFAESSSEIEFKNNTIFFQATKTSQTFSFSDNLGTRDLKIQKCNQKIIGDFWDEMIAKIKTLQSSGPKSNKATSGAWVKFEGVQSRVLDFEPALHFFDQVPNNSHVLFTESRRLCKGK